MEIYEYMYVTKLHALLIQYDRTVKQIIKIKEYIANIGRQAFKAAMYGTSQQVMQLLLRKSVAEGVKKMYAHYRLKKWIKIETMLKKISLITHHSMHGLSSLSGWDSFIVEYPDLHMLQETDPTVQGWAVMHCEFSRCS